VTISNFDATDRLVVNGLGGDDTISAAGLGTAMQLTENGGDGDDVLVGSAGADVLLGGAGNDVLIGNGGLDVLDGGTGSNTLIPSSSFAGLALFAQDAAAVFFTSSGHLTPNPVDALSVAEHSTLAVSHL
jgi:Ca2+-binding RTX toxin-like protein